MVEKKSINIFIIFRSPAKKQKLPATSNAAGSKGINKSDTFFLTPFFLFLDTFFIFPFKIFAYFDWAPTKAASIWWLFTSQFFNLR